MTEAEEKGMVLEVADWLWGTVQGSFNEQQTTSQIIVDAVIGMVPLVGDVTAVRDLLAVVLRLARDPEKRNDKTEWMLLVILLFALIPVVGGVVKGFGRLLLRAGAKTSIADVIKVLNRIGTGNAVEWLKKLDLEEYLPALRGKWVDLTIRVTNVLDRIVVKLKGWLPAPMLAHLQDVRDKLAALRSIGEAMIPDALKELNARLKLVQRQVYEGEWHQIPTSFKSSTREAEARIVEVAGKAPESTWEMKDAHHPQNSEEMYKHVEGWPDMTLKVDGDMRHYAIEGCSGPIQPRILRPGTKLYRILDHGRPNPAGNWWTYELPAGGRRWREDWAILDSFSRNGLYVELEVPSGGLWVWESKVSSQIERSPAASTGGQYLTGGATQLFVDFDFHRNSYEKPLAQSLPLKPTNWTDHVDVNIPPRTVTIQELGRHEVATKKTPAQTSARLAAKGISAQDRQTQEPSSAAEQTGQR